MERCESGRIRLAANELTWVTGSEGAKSLPLRSDVRQLVPDDPEVGWLRRACRAPSPATGLVRGVCATSWVSTGSRTPGCPKNQVDSDKLEGHLEAQGYTFGCRIRHGRSRRRRHVRLSLRQPIKKSSGRC